MPNKIEKLLLLELQHLNALRHVVSLPLYCLIFITKDIYRLLNTYEEAGWLKVAFQAGVKGQRL